MVTLDPKYPQFGQTLNPRSITVYVDADLNGRKHKHRSNSGYLTTIYGKLFPIGKRSQTIVALSLAESEYNAFFECLNHMTFSRKLYWKVASKESWREDIIFKGGNAFIDSTAEISLELSKKISKRGEQIDLRTHHVS